MNKKWFRLMAIIPLIGTLVGTNIYEDPANIFHDDSQSIARAILSGNAAYFGSGNGDERAVKKNMIEEMPKHINCVAIGPSLSMGIRKENVGTESYYNLSASGLNLNDYLAEIGLLQINGIETDRIVMCVDFYFFDENRNTEKDPGMMPYAEYMLDFLEGNNPVMPEENKWEQVAQQFEQAFSVTYFQASVAFIQSNNSYILPNKRWGVVDETTEDFAHYLSDGSWVYSSEYRANDEEDVLRAVASYDIETQFSKGNHISEYSKKVFRMLLDYMQSKETKVEFYLCPLPPALWDRIESDPDADQYYILNELEDYALDVAQEYGIKVIGSHNPYNIGITNADFLDARHVRHDMLEKYFDFRE